MITDWNSSALTILEIDLIKILSSEFTFTSNLMRQINIYRFEQVTLQINHPQTIKNFY